MRSLFVLGVVFTLSTASLAWGQAAGTAAGGSIWGKVTDETGAALPGVTVTVSGPKVMGAPESTTNEAGTYRFPSLPPGTLKLTFALPGFNTRVQTTFSKEVLASMPSARDLWAILAESPAIQMQGRADVGGSTAGTQTGYRAYGILGQNKPQIEGVIAL